MSQLAKFIVDRTVDTQPESESAAKDPAFVALGKLGASKGGRARAAKLSPKKRVAIAKLAARIRWAKKPS